MTDKDKNLNAQLPGRKSDDRRGAGILVLSRQKNESIMIGDSIKITIVDIKGDKARIGISAPRDIVVLREELFEKIRAENLAAAQSGAAFDSLGELLGKVPATPSLSLKPKTLRSAPLRPATDAKDEKKKSPLVSRSQG